MTRKTDAAARPAPRKTSNRRAKAKAATPAVAPSTLRRDLGQQTSRFAILTAIGLAAAGAGSLAAPGEAWADCILTDGGLTVVCGTTETGPNSRRREITSAELSRLTIEPGAVVSGAGLAMITGGAGGLAVENGGTVRVDEGVVPVSGGSAALNLAANGGALTYSGSGDVINNGFGDGLVAEQAGAGSIDLNIGGDVRSTTESAVRADMGAAGTGVNIVTDGDVEGGGLAGIWASSAAADGDISIRSNGAVRGGTVGITASQGGTSDGDIAITSTGAVEGGTIGIEAANQGSGAITVRATGTVRSGAESGVGTGIRTFTADNGAIDIEAADVIAGGTGISATGVGGANPGLVRIASTGSITATNGSGIEATSGEAATIAVAGAISAGIDGVRINGGTDEGGSSADVGVTVGGAVTAGRDGVVVDNGGSGGVSASIGGAVTAGGVGVSASAEGPINITVGSVTGGTGGIRTRSREADGDSFGIAAVGDVNVIVEGDIVVADGRGYEHTDGTGTTNYTQTGGITSNNGDGIHIRHGEGSGDINVDVGGPITSTGNDAGGGAADGIDAVSESVDGGITVVARGAVSGAGNGITAALTNQGATDNIAIRAEGDVRGASGSGILATSAGEDSDIVIIATGNVTGSANGAGISAELTDEEAEGGIGIGTTGDVTGGRGIHARNAGSGEVRISAGGDVTATAGTGIGVTAEGGVNIAVAGDISGRVGIAVESSQGDDAGVTINVAGGITATAGEAITLDNDNGPVNVTVGGAINATGDGVEIENRLNGGNVDLVTQDVTSTGARGIYVNSSVADTANVNVTANGDVDAALSGIEVTRRGGNGAVNVSTGGSVTGGGYGIDINRITGSGNISVTAEGPITGEGGSGIRVTRTFNNGDTTLDVGDVTGATHGIEISGSANTTGSVKVTGNGTLTAQSGSGFDYTNPGSDPVSFTWRGAIDATNGDGVRVRDTVDGGDITIDVDDVTARGVHAGDATEADAIDIITVSDEADLNVTTRGNVTADRLGIRVNNDNAGSDGDINVTAHGNVSAETGITVSNSGSGAVSVTANGDITASVGRGIYAYGNAAVTVEANGNVSSAGGAVRVEGGSNGEGDITVRGVGNLTAQNGDAVYVRNNGEGATNVNLSGDITAEDGRGLYFEGNEANGDITVALGNVSALGWVGVEIQSFADNADLSLAVAGDVKARYEGVLAGFNATNSTGDVSILTEGSIEAGYGISGYNFGTGDLSITANGNIDADTGFGINANGARNVTVEANATVTGATRGATIFGGEAGLGVDVEQDIVVRGAGGFVGEAGDALNITNRGRGDVEVNISGASSATGGSGIRITDTADAGNVDIVTGAITATGGSAILAVSASTTGNVNVTANGDLTASDTGVIAGLNSNLATGDVTVRTNGAVRGDFGISAGNAGIGDVSVTTNGDVSGARFEGLRAEGRRNVTVEANGNVSGARHGAIVIGGEAGVPLAEQDITVRGAGGFTSGDGNALYVENRGGGDVDVNISGATSATGGHGIVVTDTADGGDISITTGAITASGGNTSIGIFAQSSSARGSIAVTTNGDVSAEHEAIFASLGIGSEGDVRITANGAVRGRVGIDATSLGSGDIEIETNGAVTGAVFEGIYASGRRAVTVEANDTVSGQTYGARIEGGEAGLGADVEQDITVRGTGGFVSEGGTGLAVTNHGRGDVLIDISGATQAGTVGVIVDDTAAGGNIDVTTGAVSAGSSAINVNAATLTGNISITANGDVSATAESGILARLGDEDASGTVEVTANGDVTGGSGIRAINLGSGTVSVTARGDVTGTGTSTNGQDSLGLIALGRDDVTVHVDGTVRGGFAGAIIQAGLPGVDSDISVTGAGGFVGDRNSALVIANQGTGDTFVNISGDSSATGASGIVIDDTAAGGAVDVTVGAVRAVATASSIGPVYGIDQRGSSLTDNNTLRTTGDVYGTTGGILMGLTGDAALGDVTLITEANVTGGFGIQAFNRGFGDLSVTTNGDVTGETGDGLIAVGRGAVSVAVNGQVTGASRGMAIEGGELGGGNDIVVSGTGAVTSGEGHAVVVNNMGNGGIQYDLSGPLSATGGDGLFIRDLEIGGDINVVTGDVTALDGSGLNIVSGSRTANLDVTTNGDIEAGAFGVFAGLLHDDGAGGNLATGAIRVVTRGAVTADTGVFAQGGGQGGAVDVEVHGDVTGRDGAGVILAGAGDASLLVEGSVTGSASGAIVAAAGDITVSGAGDMTGQEGSGLSIDSAGDGDVNVALTGRVTGDNAVALLVNDTTTGGDITVSTGEVVSTGNNASHGVAVFADTTTGDVSVTTGGDVSAAGTGIVAQLASTTAAGDVTVVAEGAVSGRDGISAINVGLGAVSVTTEGAVTGTAGNGITARGGAVDITANGAVTGDLSAIAVLGGEHETGDIRVRAAAALTSTRGAAVDILNRGTGTVDIEAAGPIVGLAGVSVEDMAPGGDIRVVVDDVTATGDAFNAITVTAQSEASDVDIVANGALRAGDIGIRAVRGAGATNATGDIRITARDTIVADVGIQAVNRGTGDVTVDATGVITARDGSGVVATAVNGAIAVTTGNVSAAGVNSAGIFAQRTGAAAGDVSVTAGNVTGASGIVASNSGAGDVTVTADTASGSAGEAIFAQKTANSGEGDVDVTVRDATGRRGVVASNQGTGAARVTSTGTITASETEGVRAFAAGAGGVSVDVNNVSGGILGIHTSNNGTGATDIAINGLVTGSEAGVLAASSGDQAVRINNDGTIRNTSNRSDAIALQAGGGQIDLTNAGDIVGRLILQGDASNTVNRGSWNAIGGLSDFQGSDDRLTNTASGRIIGGADAAAGETSLWQGLEAFTNSGTIDLSDGGIGDVISTSADAVFASGGVLQVDIGGVNLADVFRTTGALTLDAGTRLEVGSVQSLSLGRRYIVASAAQGLTGEFDFEERLVSAFVGLRDGYTATDAYLELWQMRAFEEAGDTWNRRETGRGVDSLPETNPLHEAVLTLPDDGAARAAFDQLSGEIHPAMRRAMVDESRLSREAVLERLEGDGEGSVWAHGLYGRGRVSADGNASRAERDTGGAIFGADGSIAPGVTIGAAGGWIDSDIDLERRNSNGTARNVHAMGYAGFRMDRWSLRGGVGYSWTSVDTERSVAFPGVTDRLRAEYDGSVMQAFLEAGYRVPTNGGYVEPFVNLTTIHANTDAFRETGGVARIEGEGVRDDLNMSTAGFRVQTAQPGAVSARGMFGVRHMNGDLAQAGQHRFPGGDVFTILTSPHDDLSAVATFEVDWQLTPWLSLGAVFDGAKGEEGGDHAITGRLKMAF